MEKKGTIHVGIFNPLLCVSVVLISYIDFRLNTP